MTPVALLDVNILIALFDTVHTHHDVAHDWFADNNTSGWATCPLTENGLLRVLGNPARRDAFLPIAQLGGHLRQFDQRIQLAAVKGATRGSLEVIGSGRSEVRSRK